MKETPIETVYAAYLAANGITTDSRRVTPGILFWALRGARFDGNSYALAALEAGASAAVTDDASVAARDERCLYVADTERALGEMAALHRRRTHVELLLLTGTNGKTTTKELCRAVAETTFPTLATEGNFNNQIGLPLTLLRLTEKHRLAVIEAGASHPGDIQYLAGIAQPNLGIITNIGRAHLEGFGSYEGVVRTKTELYRYLRAHNGSVLLNASDPVLTTHAAEIPAFRYATDPHTEAELWGEPLPSELYLALKWHWRGESYTLQTRLVGQYNLPNVLAAIAFGLYKGITPGVINRAIEAYTPTNHRSELREETPRHHNRVVVDAYNANPSSMEAALNAFFALSSSLPKVLILGDMLELGAQSAAEHRALLTRLAAEKAPFTLYAVGDCFAEAGADLADRFRFFPTADALGKQLSAEPISHSLVLLKGSHGIGLEHLVDLL